MSRYCDSARKHRIKGKNFGNDLLFPHKCAKIKKIVGAPDYDAPQN